jgi:hypothetical protein
MVYSFYWKSAIIVANALFKGATMNSQILVRLLQVAAISFALIAVCQEMEKPKERRGWHGRAAGIVPYDFRLPTLDRLKDSYWNPYESRVFTPTVLGLGWAVNFYSLLENLRFLHQPDVSEESFLMPGEHMKEILAEAMEVE